MTAAASQAAVKRVFLIRHAESEENNAMASLRRSGSRLLSLALPSVADLNSARSLINVPALIVRPRRFTIQG